jgi:peptidoglycan/xylan/chitin deacetylase (PgdA/CDA1 family)
VPALMYHDVVPAGAEDSSGFPGRDAALYKVTPEVFEAHIAAIRDYLDSSALPASMAPVITFDDGGVSAMVAADVLERHDFRGHFFITVNYLATPGFLAERDVRELRTRGHAVGSHSCSHPLRMGRCSWNQLREEWKRSRTTLADIVGENVPAASVPGGDFTPAVAEAAAAAGFTRLFTSEPVLASRFRHGLTIQGRFVIQKWTSPRRAAALAAGAWLPCALQVVEWNAKKIGKRLGGDRYLQLRKLIIGHGDEVRWGDRRSVTRVDREMLRPGK